MDHVQQAARELVGGLRLAGDEIERRLERAASPDYWTTLVPALSLGAPGAHAGELVPIDRATLLEATARFHEDGYFQLPPIVSAALVERMRSAIGILHEHDWPAVFAWVYDEFWRVPRSAALVDMCTTVLGPGYRQARNVWTHVVGGERGQTGWAPHVDHRGEDRRLTVWIPISDATIATGCLCVLPKRFLPPAAAETWYEQTALPMAEVTRALHGVRPLPAPAGGVLGWDSGLLHWGLARQERGEPRISFSMEFVSAGAVATGSADESFAAATDDVPDFRERLKTIALALKLYQGAEPRTLRYADLADRLLDRLEN